MRRKSFQIFIASTLIVSLFAVLVYAVVNISIDTEGEFDAGTHVATDYANGRLGAIAGSGVYDTVLFANQNDTEEVDMTDTQLVVHFDDASADLLAGSEDVEDISGNSRHGEDGGTVGYGAPGIFNESLDLTSDGMVDFDDIEMNSWGELTISVWVNRTFADTADRVVSKDRIGQTDNWILFFTDTNLKWLVRESSSWATAEFTVDNNGVDGEWHHIVATVNTTSDLIELWWDGVSQDTDAFTPATLDDSDNQQVVVGSDSTVSGPGQYFTGYIDDLVIWNRTLNPDEIAALYAAGSEVTRSYTSSVQDAGSSTDWQTLVWNQEICYGCDLPDFSQNETANYFNETIDMSNSVVVFHFDETSLNSNAGGTDFYDSSGNFYHANETNGVAFSGTSVFGGAITAANNKHLEIGYLNFNGETELSVFGWARTGNGAKGTLIGSSADGSDNNFQIYKSGGDYLETKIVSNGSTYTISNSSGSKHNDDVWHFYALVIDANNDFIKFYVDNELRGELSFAQSYINFVTVLPVRMGRTSDSSPTQSWIGEFDETAILARAITAEEVGIMYRRKTTGKNFTFSARTCDDDACDAEKFTEYDNVFSPVNISDLADNQYIQFQTAFGVSSEDDLDGPYLYSVNLTDSAVSGTPVNGTEWSCPNEDCRPAEENPGYVVLGDFDLYSPTNASSDTVRTPTLQWNSSAGGSEELVTYELLVATDEAFTEIVVNVSGIAETNSSQTEYNLTDDLPVDDVYYWKVRGDDLTSSSSWTSFWQFELLSFVSITLPTNTVEFGSMLLLQNKNTSLSGGYQPITISNDGNIPLNITINGTSFFENSGGVYNFSMEENETGAFSSALLEWTEMNSTAQNALTDLYHENGSNTANVVNLNLLVVVPSEEPSGDKNSTIEVSNT